MIYFVQFIRKNIATSMLVESEGEKPSPIVLKHASVCVVNDTPRVGLEILKAAGNTSSNHQIYRENEIVMWLMVGMPPLVGSACAHGPVER